MNRLTATRVDATIMRTFEKCDTSSTVPNNPPNPAKRPFAVCFHLLLRSWIEQKNDNPFRGYRDSSLFRRRQPCRPASEGLSDHSIPRATGSSSSGSEGRANCLG